MSWLRRKGSTLLGYFGLLFLVFELLIQTDYRWNSASQTRERHDYEDILYPSKEEDEQGTEGEFYRFSNNTVVRLWVEMTSGPPWRWCLKESSTMLLRSGCVHKVHKQADQIFSVLTLPGDPTKFKLLHVRRFRMRLVRPDDQAVVRLLGSSNSQGDFWQWRRTGQLSYGHTGHCLTAHLEHNKTIMTPCILHTYRPDQVVEFAIDLQTEEGNTIGPIDKTSWTLRMERRREADSDSARGAVQTVLDSLETLEVAGSSSPDVSRRWGAVMYVGRRERDISLLSCWLHAFNLSGLKEKNFDVILFTHPSSIKNLPESCRKFREDVDSTNVGDGECLFRAVTTQSDKPWEKARGHSKTKHRDLMEILARPVISSLLTRYEMLLCSDLRSLPTPGLVSLIDLHNFPSSNLSRLHPGLLRVSLDVSPRSPTLEESIVRTASAAGIEHRGWHDLGTSVLAPVTRLHLLARLTVALERFVAAYMFGPGTSCRCSTCSQLPPECQKGGGGLHPGEVTSLAHEMALNAVLTQEEYLLSHSLPLTGDSADPRLSVCEAPLLSISQDKELAKVMTARGQYRQFNMSQLDMTMARGWSLYTALTSTGQGLGPEQAWQKYNNKVDGTELQELCHRQTQVKNVIRQWNNQL